MHNTNLEALSPKAGVRDSSRLRAGVKVKHECRPDGPAMTVLVMGRHKYTGEEMACVTWQESSGMKDYDVLSVSELIVVD